MGVCALVEAVGLLEIRAEPLLRNVKLQLNVQRSGGHNPNASAQLGIILWRSDIIVRVEL